MFDDVVEGFNIWTTRNGLNRLLKGGLHRSKPPQDSVLPYARLQLASLGNMSSSGDVYVQRVKITINVYTYADAPERALVNDILSRFNRESIWSVANGRVLDVKDQEPTLADPGPQHRGREVALIAAAWEVWIERKRVGGG